MKLFIVLSLCVAATMAGTFPGLLPRLPKMPASFSDEMDGRITNGEIAKLGEFPYQAALEIKSGNDNYFCGGTIIGDRHVLTAAHCMDAADSVVVTAGAVNIRENEKQQEKIAVDKKFITVHAGWNPSTLTNDIAIIELPVALKFSEFIDRAILPKAGENFDGLEVVASGWGKPSDSATSISPELRYVYSTVMPSSTCARYYLGAKPTETVCMKSDNGKSTCNGDSGGPLVNKQNGKNVVIGATSFGISLGCEVGWPGVFTAVGSYLDWINKVSGVRSG